MIKLMAFDLDGTLVDRKHIVSEENKKAIDRARAAGIKIAITTGRGPTGIKNIARQIDADKTSEYLVGYNGGIIFRYVDSVENSELVREKLFTPDEVAKVFEIAKRHKIKLITYTNCKDYVLANKKSGLFIWWMKRRIKMSVRVYNKNKYPDISVYKFISFGKTKNAINYRKELVDLGFETFAWSYVTKSSTNIEVNPHGMNKAFGLEKLCEIYKIKPAEIMYFGDGENDISALDFVEEGVAMENAPDKIKAHAKHVTGHHLKSGVADMINKYLDSIK